MPSPSQYGRVCASSKEKRSTISIADLHLDRRLAGTCGRGREPRAGCSPPPTVVPAKGETTPITEAASGGSASILRDTFAPRSAGPRTQCASLGHSVQRMDCSPSDAGPLAGAPIDEYPSAVASGWCGGLVPRNAVLCIESRTLRFWASLSTGPTIDLGWRWDCSSHNRRFR